MKIGVNYKKIMSYIDDMMNNLFEKITTHTNDISSLNTRVTTLENNSGGGGSEWVEITSANGQEAKEKQMELL